MKNIERAFVRSTFAHDRLAEFATRDGLEKQTGHRVRDWPLVVAKEVIDNALDEAEKIGVAPLIDVAVDTKRGTVTISDNGGGIEPDTVKRITDFRFSVSDKAAYVSPTRGAQGNALSTVLAMPFVLDPKRGETIIESRGFRHTITFTADPITRVPQVAVRTNKAGSVKSGTRVSVQLASSLLREVRNDFFSLVQSYWFLNPHLTLSLSWDKHHDSIDAIDRGWTKWSPNSSIPAHWYTVDRFELLIRAHLVKDRDGNTDTMLRDFIAQFRGLSGTQKRSEILDKIGAGRMKLSSFFDNGNNTKGVAKLLRAMQSYSNNVNPKDLSVIGREALRQRFADAGGEMETFRYCQKSGVGDGVPWVVETAFGWLGEDAVDQRRLLTGVNFSPAIINPFRHIGADTSLDDLLSGYRAGPYDPVLVLVHLTCPRLSYTDRGKSVLVLSDRYVDSETDEDMQDLVEASQFESEIGTAIGAAVQDALSKWTKARRAEERGRSRIHRSLHLIKSKRITLKDACFRVMEASYLHASNNGRLPANARQIMYAARRRIQQLTDAVLNDNYFTQTLLPAYRAEHAAECADWDVAYDVRGNFSEPHTGISFGVGTLNVRDYLADIGEPEIVEAALADAHVKTHGPKARFGGVFYIEKEGFDPLFERVDLFRRFDLAWISNKGQSVTASRELAERLCAKLGGVPLYVLHDFDKAGFSIRSTLERDTKRYQFKTPVKVIDLGLRLDDVRALGIEDLSERHTDKGSAESRAANLRLNGATEEEVEFLLTRRVELNALTSAQLIAFIERKLRQHRASKVVPAPTLLADTYRAQLRAKQIRAEIESRLADLRSVDVSVPDDITVQVKRLLRQHPEWSWDKAVAEMVKKA